MIDMLRYSFTQPLKKTDVEYVWGVIDYT